MPAVRTVRLESHRAALAVIGALLVLACAPKQVRDKGMKPALSTAEVLEQARRPRRVAVLVGVDAYRDPVFTPLKHAGHDATALARVLESEGGGGFDRVVVLTGAQQTTRDAIAQALIDLRDGLRRDDVLVIYFSGHGTRERDGDRWRRFLLPHDASSRDLEGSAMELSYLQRFFGSLAPARKALIVDACFSGDGKSVVRPDDRAGPVDTPLVPDLPALAAGEAHLFATSAGRPAREEDRLGHGVYTYHLLDALSWSFAEADLDADGVVTAWEAHDHARVRTLEHTDGQQVPEAALRILGEADVVLAGDPAARGAMDRSLVYLYPGSDHPLDGASLFIDGTLKGGLPGTAAIPSGRRHVVVQDADGDVVVDGYMTLTAGRVYPVHEVARVAQGPRQNLGLRATTLVGLEQALGPAAGGFEVWYASRANRGAGRGLYGDVGLTLGLARQARLVSQAAVSAGYQGDVGKARLRLGWGLAGVWIPPVDAPSGRIDPFDVPARAGWVFYATGPSAAAGYVVGGGWAVTATLRPHGALLDLDGDGVASLTPWLSAGIGVEVAR